MSSSQAVTEFLTTISAAEELIKGSDLLPKGASVIDNQAIGFMQNGVATSLFSAFEDFLWERSREVASSLSSIPFSKSSLPNSLIQEIEGQSVRVLGTQISNQKYRKLSAQPVEDFASTWNGSKTAVGIPHSYFVWTGSNANSEDVLRPLKGLGVAEKWDDLVSVITLLGTNLSRPTKQVFEEIANVRHRAAHSPTGISLVELRPIPQALRFLAFSYDSLLSSAGYKLKKGIIPDEKGRKGIDLFRIEQSSNGKLKFCKARFKPRERGSYSVEIGKQGQRAAELRNKGYTVVEVKRESQQEVDIIDWWSPI